MKNVGIVTLNGYFNYGNRLQNYALQESLKSLGLNVNTLIVENNYINTPEKRSLNKRLRDKSIIDIFKFIKYRFKNTYFIEVDKNRIELFRLFSNKYLNEIKVNITEKNFSEEFIEKYDFFIVGSDQVWNPNYIKGSSLYFLSFAPKEKRISYAASFGISEIPYDLKPYYSKYISELEYISVREERGASIIKDLIGHEVEVHVDPTLLISKEKWLGIAEKVNITRQYLLTYFLGEISPQYRRLITRLAKSNNLIIINLTNYRNKRTSKIGPSQFISHINNCSIFCTDSFHGTVFSILFEKPFVVFERYNNNSMFSRLDTLLKKFLFSSRKIENLELMKDVFNIDFSHVPAILENERKKSISYLKNALSIKEEV